VLKWYNYENVYLQGENMMKRILSILLVAVTIIGVITVVAFSSTATDVEENYYVSGDYTYCVLGNTDAKIVGYSGTATKLSIPEKIDNYTVTYIDEFAFMECGFTEVTVPESVVSIGDNAFVGCVALTDIAILNIDCEIFDSEYTVPETATIHGYDNSTAYDYAVKYEKTFESLGVAPSEPTTVKPTETEPTVPTETEPTTPSETKPASPDQEKPTEPTEPVVPTIGDVDMDGKVSVMDATAIQQHVAQLTVIEGEGFKCADTDKDGKVSVMDATKIQLFVAEIIPEI
jgi:hypothetical protein